MPVSTSVESLPRTSDLSVPATAVVEQLGQIVKSPVFTSSPRLCRFLSHVVNRTLQADVESLKEFSIAMEVFDRNSDYDPNIDAIVRVEARRLRGKLKAYYEVEPGKSDPILIGLRPGSYVPIFRWLDKQPSSSPQEPAPAFQSAAASVAVLPFVNMSPDPEQDYFCDGISEEIISSLTRVPGLKVIARMSAFEFKGMSLDIREVARRLDADVVIEGSVRKAGDQLRISAQAVHAESGLQLWSEMFRRELKDVFAVQEDIAHAVAGALRVHRPQPRQRAYSGARNIEAYTRYLNARVLIHQQSPETLGAAVDQLRGLVEAFPGYALGHSGLAAASGHLAFFGVVSGRDAYPEVKAAAERGYVLDPESGETCTVLGALRAWFEYRWDEADRLYERALNLQPGHAPAHVFRAMACLCQGDLKAAESGLRRSTKLDPLCASDCARLAYLDYLKAEFCSAEEHLQRSFKLDRDYPEARFYRGLLRYRQQDFDGVVNCLCDSELPLKLGLLAAAFARKGCGSKALECLEKLSRLAEVKYVSPLAEAFAAIGMEHFDLAFQRLDEAIEHKTNFVNLLAVEPFFDPLRNDQRFTRLLEKLNLSK